MISLFNILDYIRQIFNNLFLLFIFEINFMKNFLRYLLIPSFILNFIYNIDIKNINENSQLTFPLKQDICLSISLFINDKEYNLPIDINADRTWINTNDNTNNKIDKNIILEECEIPDKDIKRKKNIPISFFDKDIKIDEIAYEEINNDFNLDTCNTKNGIIGLSNKSEKKILNLLTQINKVYSIKKSFSIFNNQLILGNFDDELKQNKHVCVNLLDAQNKWGFNLQGIYYGEIDKSNYQDDYFLINKMNNNYRKINAVFSFNSLQRFIIVDYYYFEFINNNIFKNKCNIKTDDQEKFTGIYCDKKTIETLPDLSFLIDDKMLPVPINKLFIQDKNSLDEYLFAIVFSEIVWDNGYMIGNLFYNELGYKVIFDAESNHIYFLSDKIIEKVKIIDEYSIDERQNILNNYSFSIYDYILSIILILNFLGIIMLLGSLYKEKIINQLPDHIKKINRMNK